MLRWTHVIGDFVKFTTGCVAVPGNWPVCAASFSCAQFAFFPGKYKFSQFISQGNFIARL
jgi:hypothetical protein